MRTFIAIKLPLNIKNTLAKIQNELGSTLSKINWVNLINLHLSLKFLGDISAQQLAGIQKMIAQIAKTSEPFEIKLETLGVFSEYRQVRIIWIGTNQPPLKLKELVDRLEKKSHELKIPKEKRPFQTHITLGRIKHPLPAANLEKSLDRLKNVITEMNLKFACRGITLFLSTLEPNGPTYTVLKEAAFEGFIRK